MITSEFEDIKKRIENARGEAGLAKSVKIVGVVKYQTIEDANALILKGGITDIAENYVQALTERAQYFLPSTRHLIGHLQTNKVKQALAVSDVIQSVDSVKLLKELEKQASKLEKTIDVLFQVNIAKEDAKTGIFEENLDELFFAASEMPHVRVKGLMSIMPIETKLLYYQKMYALFLDKRDYLVHNICSDNISMDYLSMGMSSDYETAVRCGSNMVRLGRCLFQ